jgi:cytochrome c biogenesis protein CcmG, thiol:disulfide interchange protein DsbE
MTTTPLLPDQSRPLFSLRVGLAALCFAGSALILMAAGLPDRAELNTLFFLPNGRSVAPEVGALAPPINLITLDGEYIATDTLTNRIVVLNYWATWCAPCQVEMPALQELAERYPTALTVLGINAGEPPEAIRAWRDHFGLTFPLMLDPDGTAARDYRLRGQPTTVIVAPGGIIHKIIYGPADLDALERAIVALLPVPDERRHP